MSDAGKKIRWGRFFHEQPRFGIVVPIDHGLTLGPMQGIESIDQIASWLRHPVITGTIAHKGIVERLAQRQDIHKLGVMVHLTGGMCAGAPHSDQKERLTSIDAALALGADAVSLQTNFDGTNDAHNLRLLGSVVDEAQRFGLPVLAMVYDTHREGTSIRRQRHLMRVAMELGVDAIKIAPPEDLQVLPELLDSLASDVDIFVAGGIVRQDEDVLKLAQRAICCGAAGLCIGRNVFQRAAPEVLLDRIRAVLEAAGIPPTPVIRGSGVEREPAARVAAHAPTSTRMRAGH